MKKTILAVFVISLLISFASLSSAVPVEVNYQGYLTDTNGVPVDGTTNITFRLYDVESGGSSLWDSGAVAVDVANGVYSVILGDTSAGSTQPAIAPAIFANQLWLGVEIETDGEMSPRQRLTATGYAIKAQSAETVDASGQGEGSSLDADTVDTLHASDLLDKATYDIDDNAKVDSAESADTVNVPLTLTGSEPGVGDAAALKVTNTSGGYSVFAENTSGGHAVFGKANGGTGVVAQTNSGPYAVSGSNLNSGTYGYLGTYTYGVHGWHFASGNQGYLGSADYGVYGESSTGYAGYFAGDVHLTGVLSGNGSELTNIVHDWNNLINVPVGFADGLDDNSGGTVTQVDTGTGLTGGTVTTTGTIAIDTSIVPQLGEINTFTQPQNFNALTTPFTVASTNMVNNLNAEMVEGQHASDFAQQSTTYTMTEVDSLISSLQDAIIFTLKSWGMEEIIDNEVTDAGDPQVVMDETGNAIAVWRQDGGGGIYDVWANRYVSGVGWGTAEIIDSGGGNAFAPQVAMDETGNAIAVWRQDGGGGIYDVWANRYVSGVGWGATQLIESGSGNASDPQVAIDTSGNAIAVWNQDLGGSAYDLLANRYVSGVGWGNAQLIENNAFIPSNPDVAMDPSGNAIAVWYQSSGVNNDAWANRYVSGVGWGTAELIENNSGNLFFPKIAMDASGNAIAVWHQDIGGSIYDIWANRYVSGVGWGTAELIGTGEGAAAVPQIAMNESGNAIVVWHQNIGGILNILANRYGSGVGWGTAQLIENSSTGDAFSAQVAMDTKGNAIAVWQNVDVKQNIVSNRYVTGIGWGNAQLIENNAVNSYKPQIAMKRGYAAVVWYSTNDIWANVYGFDN